jgi:hypothetical protein
LSNRLSWIKYKGARILHVDYSGTSEEEFIQTIEEFKDELLKQTPGSVVTLTNMADARITDEVRKKFKAIPHKLLRDLTQEVLIANYLHSTPGETSYENPQRILLDKANCVHL